MAEIRIRTTRQVENQLSTPVLNRTQATGADFGGQLFKEVENQANQWAQVIQKQTDNAKLNQFKNDEYEYKNKVVNDFVQTSKGHNTLADAETLRGQFKQWEDDYRAKHVGSRYQSVFDQQVTQNNQMWFRKVQAHQNTEIEQFNNEQFAASLANNVDAIGNNPNDDTYVNTMIADSVQRQASFDASHGVSEDVMLNNRLAVTTTGRLAVVDQKAAAEDYRGALNYLDTHKQEIDPATRAKYEKNLRQSLKQKSHANDAMLKADLTDYRSYLLNGGDPIKGKYTKGTLIHLYGDEAGSRLYSRIKDEEAFSVELNAMRFTPLDDDLAKIKSEQENLRVSPKNFGEENKQLNIKVKAFQQKTKALSNNPVAYLASSPVINSAREAAKESDDYSEYAAIVLNEQRNLGLSESQSRVLSNEDAAGIVAKFKKGGESAQVLLNQLRELYGENAFPYVMKDLSRAKLPSTAKMVATLGNNPGAVDLSDASRFGYTELKANVGNEDYKTIADETRVVIDDEFKATLFGSSYGPEIEADVREATEQLAMYYLDTGRTGSPESAVSLAFGNIIHSQYHFVDTGDSQFRVPRTYTNDDVDTINDRLDGIKEELAGEDIPLFTPYSTLTGIETLRSKIYKDNALSNARWLTNNGDTGVTLIDGKQDAVLDENGEPITYTWDELLQFGDK